MNSRTFELTKEEIYALIKYHQENHAFYHTKRIEVFRSALREEGDYPSFHRPDVTYCYIEYK